MDERTLNHEPRTTHEQTNELSEPDVLQVPVLYYHEERKEDRRYLACTDAKKDERSY